MYHVMIDLETLGVHQTAPVVSVGMAMFRPTGQSIVDTHEVHLNVDAQSSMGRHASIDTLAWWLRQDEAARDTLARALRAGVERPLFSQLNNISEFIRSAIGGHGDPDAGMVWGYGANEDTAWLSGLFDGMSIPRPWHYRKVACYRTILREHGATGDDWVAPTVAHDPVADAVAQAKTLQRICARTGRNMEGA